MSSIEVLAVIGIIGYIIFRQVQGEHLRGKRVVVLPLVLTVIGFTDLHGRGGAAMTHADIACIAVGAVGSALIGVLFGVMMRLESRGGRLWAQLPVRGLWLWGALIAWRVVTEMIATGAHAEVAASSATLLFGLGINRLAQAAVVVPRALAAGIPFAPEKDGKTFMSGAFEQRGAGRWDR
ncbi:hypothetical protein ACIRS1_05245 [Kitasatospora sp. NPDC101176]|uniref:hypothetical protein n=1 Tax=Kitasatospora sp. NPDC101176 TaxID=3364099 RepID=UPI00380B8E6C